MNSELIKALTPKEYITTFTDKNLRVDRRSFEEKRRFTYQFGILDTFTTSASCLLGDGNKVIIALKSSTTLKGDGDKYLGK